ncbi:polysaccharide deacetylase family protein [Luteibaculum oceani]|uniref:Polysaccharide deacetylase family protein n=1 Tax=Luteibaculum oceani TaxID=1294296 RepID=A0A5C6VIW9_9FLAO|nr:polysaccharide deacetylase family protein [Luteibaculum oceani]TXC85097.1 polysaccharide deacetylase family protein [Luteibaculum oceani]
MIPANTPQWIQKAIPGVLWRVETAEKELYLTFDDGPIPEVTPWVLDLLLSYNAQATFFCIGDNVQKHPAIYQRIIEEGHGVANHTQNHLNGWKSSKSNYVSNVEACSKWVDSKLFRPPYGKFTKGQLEWLKRRYTTILWSVLSKDYSKNLSPQQVLDNALKCKEGDIIVFHDSLKARKNLEYVLPRFLEHYQNLGYTFKSIKV